VLLRAHARNHNLRLSQLARDVADGTSAAAEVLHGQNPTSSPVATRLETA